MKKKIFTAINYTAGFLALISACMVDSVSYIPLIVFTVCMLWLGILAYLGYGS